MTASAPSRPPSAGLLCLLRRHHRHGRNLAGPHRYGLYPSRARHRVHPHQCPYGHSRNRDGRPPFLPAEDILRTIALFRFINPTANIRLAAGRKLLPDNGESALLHGASASITGNMLTTSGTTIKEDMEMIARLGLSQPLITSSKTKNSVPEGMGFFLVSFFAMSWATMASSLAIFILRFHGFI